MIKAVCVKRWLDVILFEQILTSTRSDILIQTSSPPVRFNGQIKRNNTHPLPLDSRNNNTGTQMHLTVTVIQSADRLVV